MKYFISKIIPHRDRCWEALTFKNRDKHMLAGGMERLFNSFTTWSEGEEGRENKELEEVVEHKMGSCYYLKAD